MPATVRVTAETGRPAPWASRLSSDAVVLLACARAGAEPQALPRALSRVRNWDGLPAAAARQGMSALLYRRVAELCPGSVPAGVLARLRSDYERTALRSLVMSRHLLSVMDLLESAGVTAMTFKGAALAEQAYGDATMRSFCDLDLLLPRREAARAWAALAAHGFTSIFAPYESEHDAVLLDIGHEIVMRREKDGLTVELHDQAGSLLGGGTSVSATDLLTRAETIEILGRPLHAPGRSDLVVLQCLHGTRHTWTSLEHVVCTVELIRRLREDDWPAVLDRATASRSRRAVLVGVVLACIVGGLDVPHAVLSACVADGRVLPLVAEALAMTQGSLQGTRVGSTRQSLWLARCESTTSASARLVARRLFTPTHEDWGRRALPPRWFSFYFLLRPLRLAKKYTVRRTRWYAASPTRLAHGA